MAQCAAAGSDADEINSWHHLSIGVELQFFETTTIQSSRLKCNPARQATNAETNNASKAAYWYNRGLQGSTAAFIASEAKVRT